MTQRSLVLITVDCLRADHCSFYGYGRPTTPFLNSLEEESLVVPAAITAGVPTYYSLPAILASRMPLAFGRDVIGLAPGEDTLASALQASGYATAGFSAANPYISPHFGYAQGFDAFRDYLNSHQNSEMRTSVPEPEVSAQVNGRSNLNRKISEAAASFGLSRLYGELYFQYCARFASSPKQDLDSLRRFPSAKVLVDDAKEWLTSLSERPFFLWIHLMEPHAPYYPDEEAFRELSGRKLSPDRARYLNAFWNRSDLGASQLRRHRDEVMELYDAGIRSADWQIARLAAHLKDLGRWDSCVFVLTADHGEEFLEHGGRFHAPLRLTEELVRVPLLIRVPDRARAEVPSAPFSQLHLAPTLMQMLGVDAPAGFQGRSVWRNLQSGTPWNESVVIECGYGCNNPFRAQDRMTERLLAVRDDRYKLVYRLTEGAIEQLYDLQRDPCEQREVLKPVDAAARKRLLQAARSYLVNGATKRDPTPGLRARLQEFRAKNSVGAS